MHHDFKSFLFAALILQNFAISTSINATLDFDIIGEGFHRTFEYKVSVDGLENQQDCAVALHILLPSAIYVNVDEVADLQRVGKTLTCSVGERNVELFAEMAEPQNVTICNLPKTWETVLSLPIHQRYQFSQEYGGYIAIDIPHPKLLLGCKERLKHYRVSKIDLCSPCVDLALKWREIPFKMEHTKTVWLIPVGNTSYLNYVSYVTLLVTSLGAAAVLQTMLRLGSVSGSPRTKQN
ncbi:phosphatidylinositol-glycan biosynthesis class X protein [Neodiprion virginianus]|uniref:phosphatidylinositol-glycan biosynthesis class X protein n=1 Tax=Neodiprion virginianus TaxID=2961670 RepID=UPI001EE718F8|nr:phosphatidylinositol-glycan biosynthesis class X protein [Neodiprion virginianus]